MTERPTAKTVQGRPGVERFGGVARFVKERDLEEQCRGNTAESSEKNQDKEKEKGREEGKDGSRERRRCKVGRRKLPLDEAFFDFYIRRVAVDTR